MAGKPKREKSNRSRSGKDRVVTVEVVIKNTPPDAAALERQRKAMEIILKVLARPDDWKPPEVAADQMED